MSNESNYLYEFGEYVLNAKERNLWRNKELIKLPSKAFDTLFMLVERHGEVLSKEEMLDVIWEGAFVEENNLSQKISILRRIFGRENQFIQTVPKKGFRFVAQVKSSSNGTIETSEKVRKNENSNKSQVSYTSSQKAEIKNITITKSVSKNRSLYILLGIFLGVSIVSILGFNYFRSVSGTNLTNPPNFALSLLTNTDDVTSTAISPDGKFVASLIRNNGNPIFNLRDVESGNDVKVKIQGDVTPGFIRFSPDGKTILFRTKGVAFSPQNIYKISYFGGEPELVAENVWGLFNISANGKQIAFYRVRSHNTRRSLVVKNILNGDEKVIIDYSRVVNIFLHMPPVWILDDTKLAYIYQNKNPKRSKITTIDIKSKQERVIETDLSGIQRMGWLPDANKLILNAVKDAVNYQIWTIDYASEKSHRITNDLNNYRGFSVTSDGSKFVTLQQNFSSNVWIFRNANISKAERITNGSENHIGLSSLLWLNKNRLIYDKFETPNRHFWQTDLKKETSWKLSEQRLSFNSYPTISDKNDLIYFGTKSRIWKINTDGTKLEDISLEKGYRHFQPVLSPDNKWLYFIKSDQRSTSIWRRSFVTNETEKVYEPKDFIVSPLMTISPDGKHLAFRCFRGVKEGKGDSKGTREIGFLKLSDKTLRLKKLKTERAYIRWTNNGKSFDFYRNTKEGGKVFRQSFADFDATPKIVFHLQKESIFNFDWSPNEKDIAIARGKRRSNTVIFTTNID